jgi:hypothetical protein
VAPVNVDEEQVWNGVASAAAIGAVMATKPLVERVWTAVARREAPGNPAHQDVSWGEALAWALVTGALVGVIRLLAQRLAASAWAKATGDYPEALRTTRP